MEVGPDKQTDGQTDRPFPIYTPPPPQKKTTFAGGYKYKQFQFSLIQNLCHSKGMYAF